MLGKKPVCTQSDSRNSRTKYNTAKTGRTYIILSLPIQHQITIEFKDFSEAFFNIECTSRLAKLGVVKQKSFLLNAQTPVTGRYSF